MTTDLETTEPETSDCVMCPQTDPVESEPRPKPKRSHHKSKAKAAPPAAPKTAAVPSLDDAKAMVRRAEEYLYASIRDGCPGDELDLIRDEMWDARGIVWQLEKGAAS